ncbi:MAG: PD40 domain-containing protein [Ignavibacteriae bacterium]|nr:PD40 domain-containing protein [Ignavibacteriota bacterium]
MRSLTGFLQISVMLISYTLTIHAQKTTITVVAMPKTLTETGTLNDYNPHNYNIPDNGSSVNSDLLLTGAPANATITKIKIYYEIRHTFIGDLKVWLTAYYNGGWHDFILKNREGGSADDIVETRDNLTTWNGASPNQTWYLVVQDFATGDVGYIDFFELWVTYTYNVAPNTPSNEVPSDGANSVSVNSDLDWTASDPDGDVLYFTVYFEKNDATPDIVIKNDATGSFADPGTLDYNSHYYWQVKADDHKGGITWGPVWDFYTEPVPITAATITVASIGTIVAGNSINVNYTVTNTGNDSRTFGIGGEIWEGSTRLADLGCQTTTTVDPGNSTSGYFPYLTPEGLGSGTYTARAAAWTATCGSSTWLDSYDRNFTVQQTPLTISGRVAYHSYSKYMAVPATGNDTDGNIFIYNIGSATLQNITSSLSVVSAMNPHFSPDGSKLVFMAVPQSKASDIEFDASENYWHRKRTNLDIYLYDLAGSQLTNLTPNIGTIDEDPKFSPDGLKIVWKREGQIWKMNVDGSSQTQLTFTSDEKSGPNYSPDGSKIVYWSEKKSTADIWWMNANGTSPNALIATSGIQEYYPIYRDANNILYTRWESATYLYDKIYNYNIVSGDTMKLPINENGVEYADASPVDDEHFVFSSNRSGSKGTSPDIYIGRYDYNTVYPLSGANSNLQDLGASYSPTTGELGVNEKPLPNEFLLEQNYPNPFNPSTNIRFALAKSSYVLLKIFNLLGKEIATVVNEEMSAGYHITTWDAKNQSSGMYFYRLETGNFSQMKKLILIK